MKTFFAFIGLLLLGSFALAAEDTVKNEQTRQEQIVLQKGKYEFSPRDENLETHEYVTPRGIPGFQIFKYEGEKTTSKGFGPEAKERTWTYDPSIDSGTSATSSPVVFLRDFFISPVLAFSQSAVFVSASSQYFSITDAAQTGLDLNATYTLEMWVSREAACCTGEDTFASKYSVIDEQRGYTFFHRNSGGVDQIVSISSNDGAGANNVAIFDIDNLIPEDEWHHVALTIDLSANEAKFYLDGVQTGGTQSAADGSGTHNNTADFRIGAGEDATDFWDGNLLLARAWSVVRTEAEIADNMCNILVTGTGLQGEWTLDGDAVDETSNNNDLTNNNSVTFEAYLPDCPGGTFAPWQFQDY